MTKYKKYYLIYDPSGVTYWRLLSSPKNSIVLGVVIMNGIFKGIHLRTISQPEIRYYSNTKRVSTKIWVDNNFEIRKTHWGSSGRKWNHIIEPPQKIQMEHEQFKIEPTSNGWNVVFKNKRKVGLRSVTSKMDAKTDTIKPGVENRSLQGPIQRL
jgi:hypothetical protein